MGFEVLVIRPGYDLDFGFHELTVSPRASHPKPSDIPAS